MIEHRAITPEDEKKVEDILNPFRCDAYKDRIRIDDCVPYDKLAEVIDYLRYSVRVTRDMCTYPMALCLWKDGRSGFNLRMTTESEEVTEKSIELKFGGRKAFYEFINNLQKQVEYLLKELKKEEEK